MLTQKTEHRTPTGIPQPILDQIKAFLLGATYCWNKNCKSSTDNKYLQFAAHDLIGGENYNWSGSPLQFLYDKHIENGKTHEQAVEQAGKDAGWILKQVIDEDPKHRYKVTPKGLVNGYTCIEALY